MQVKVIKTNILTIEEKKEICLLYKEVFKREKSIEQFIHEFERNEFGFSYFALLFDNDSIVGSYAVIPLKFKYFDKDLLFGQAVNTMIKEEYRGNPFMLKKMANAVYSKMKEDGISFVYGFPNDNIYLVRKKILKWCDIDNLDIYVLPIRIGNIKSILRPFNIFTIGLSKILNLFANKTVDKEENFFIYKEYSSKFEKYRFTNLYKKIILSENIHSFYKVQDFKNIKTAFIVDVNPLTKNNLELTVKRICYIEKNIDLIVYFGHLPFTPINMFKLPETIKPKNTFMAGKILDNNLVDESIFNVKNWRTNLSNFDWI